MRIISKFKDYYDGAQGFGIDPSIVYLRETLELWYTDHRGKQLYFDKFPWRCFNDTFEHWNFTLYFCGKAYPCKAFRKHGKLVFDSEKNENVWYEGKEHFLWSFEQYKDFFDRIELEEMKRGKRRQIGDKQWKYRWSQTIYPSNFYQVLPSDQQILDIHHKYNSPIVLKDCRGVFINPNIGDAHFYEVKDPFTTFQDISQFVGGVLKAQTTKMVEISDEVRAEKHGFDKTTSFRKPAGEKKPRKKRRTK
jgi:hypothetical protein